MVDSQVSLDGAVTQVATTNKDNGRGGAGKDSDRRLTILRAAVDVFARKGYHGCRIADVASEAGVAYGLVYHYFKNKDELLQTVFDMGWGGFIQRITEALGRERSLAAQVRAVTDVAFEAYRHDPRGVRVLILEIARSPAGGRVDRHGVFSEVLRIAADMFEQARARGELREGLNPVLCASMLFGALEMALTASVLRLVDLSAPGAMEHAKEQVASTFLGGVLAPGLALR